MITEKEWSYYFWLDMWKNGYYYWSGKFRAEKELIKIPEKIVVSAPVIYHGA